MEKQIFNFIQRKTPTLLKVLEVKFKDTDDEHGITDEYYVVRCLLQAPDISIPINNMLGEKEKVCLVNISEFNSWLKSEDSIKWI